MPVPNGRILTVNGGSSSIKFAAFDPTDPPRRRFTGQIDRIGQPGSSLTAKTADNTPLDQISVDAPTHAQAAAALLDWLRPHLDGAPVLAVGHRVVHGGVHLLDHQLVDDNLLDELRRTQPLDLAHLPREIALLDALRTRLPGVPQIACFDTAFHRDLPRIHQLLPIPLSYFRQGVRRLGFHGLSYTYLLAELRRQAGPAAADGKVILAHLGAGASMAAVHHGRPIDTTMAFTPTAGLVMGARPGDLDPGLLVYLMRAQHLSPEQTDEFISHRCGLLGLSETSPDLRDLQSRRPTDPRAADALDVFYLSARKWIGALAASLGGLDTLVFSGGIGQHSPAARAAICHNLSHLGIHLDDARNAASAPLISTDASPVAVRVIPTDEELVIAETVAHVLGWS